MVLDAKYRKIVNDKDETELSPDMACQLYDYSKILEEKYRHKVPAVLIFPSSEDYNTGLGDKSLEFEFFDKTKLYVVTYDMELLKKGRAPEADRNFIEVLNKVIGSQGYG